MSERAPVAVVGAGGHAKVVLATLEAAGHPIAGVFDDDPGLWGRNVLGHVVEGPSTRAAERCGLGVIAVGANRVRRDLASRLKLDWLVLVHPAAVVHPTARLGAGTVVFAGAVIQPDASLGRHVIVNTAATVDHDCVIGDHVHLGPGVNLCGGVSVGEGVLLGVGACAIPGVRIGNWCTVGAGAAVIRDIPAGSRAVGVPAVTDR